MKKNKFYYILNIFILLTIILLFSYSISYADPKLISKMTSAFQTIEKWIIKVATPIAAVAVGVAALMQKFSFGDEEKIRIGKKLLKGSLFSYAFILAIDLILGAIESLI